MLDVLTDFSHDLSKTHAMNLVDPLILIKTGLYSEQIFTHPVDSWISLSKKKIHVEAHHCCATHTGPCNLGVLCGRTACMCLGTAWCWCYGPNKSSNRPSIDDWFYQYCFNTILGEKLGMNLWIGQPCVVDQDGGPFSRVWLHESCHVQTTWDIYGRGLITDWVWDVLIRFSLYGVHQFKSLRLSDMSNHLSYGCQDVYG
jgi:hypothetical protein